jgi:hypothetical protein
MTLSSADGAPTRSPAPDAARVVVIVPRRETRLHEYLRRSLAPVKNVEVILDRRATVLTPPDDRRRLRSKDSERKILICSLVHCPAAVPSPEPTPGQDQGPDHRTLLWPGLRLEHL